MANFNYRILYGAKTFDGRYTENQMEFESEEEVTSENLEDVLRTIGYTYNYAEVALTKIDLIVQDMEVIDDVEG